MNIVPKLNLNKHPKDNINLSLVNGLNMKLTHDESSLTNEEGIRENTYIHQYLSTYYDTVTYKIVGCIACNNEIVVIVKPTDTATDSDIFRYQEPINGFTESMYCAYGGKTSINRFKYQGGDIKGVFTYNVENSLVVAITEYNVVGVKIPLRTINLGNVLDNTIYNDKDLPNGKLSTGPEVKLPSVSNLDYIAGGAYKGWYYMFIRYKLNTVDYSQWYSIGTPIYVDSLEQYQILRYCYNRDTHFGTVGLAGIVYPPNPEDGYGAGCSDYFSNSSDIAKETFKVDFITDAVVDYTKYQIGLICTSKAYTKAFRTNDISVDSNYSVIGSVRTQKYVLDNKSLIEYDVTSLITDNPNYFNIKRLFNYQNRLYIGNYLEDNANNKSITSEFIGNINVGLTLDSIKDYGLVYDTALIGNSYSIANQYDTYDMTTIPLYKYLNISPDVLVTISSTSQTTKTGKSGQIYIMTGGANPGFAYIQLREAGSVNTDYGKYPTQENVNFNIPNMNNEGDINITLDTHDLAMDGGMRYTNTNISFNDRKRKSSLIPGEIYNLFIHFTNKYGQSTNGYKLNNKTIWDTVDAVGVEIIPIPFKITIVGTGINSIYYAAMPVNENVAIETISTASGYDINMTGIKFYKSFVNSRLTDAINIIELTDCIDTFRINFASYCNNKYTNTKWYQVSYGPGESYFHLFINSNGDRLFKVPVVESFDQYNEGTLGGMDDYKTFNTHKLLQIIVSNIEIPEEYDGYYISYEKFESHRRATGLLSRNDFRSQDHITTADLFGTTIQVDLDTNNGRKSDKMFFYSSVFDISDTLKLDYNIIRFEGVNVFKKQDIPEWDYFQRNRGFNFVHDMNKPEVEPYGIGVQRTYAIPEYKIVVADSAIDNRMGLGTALQLTDSYNLFPNYDPSDTDNNKIKLYRVTLLNTTRDIYMSTSKWLVKLTDIQYRTIGAPTNQKYGVSITNGYNGHYTYDGIPIYENAGLSFNTTTNKATTFISNNLYYKDSVPNETAHSYQNDYPFLAYLQLPICSDVFFESKSFKNKPTGIIYQVTTSESHNTFAKGSMVTPANSIDLFENRQGSADQFNPKTYANYREDLVSVEQFDKTVRRSNVIQDENRAIGWRVFPIEGYKNITENKGKITNILGIGYMLLVHTEHSLFMFDTNNSLETKDKSIQLSQPDTFEVNYREVFTSDKGFGGLQDDKSFILDNFGYIFYSEDTNRIYHFDNGQLAMIDDDIIQWLTKYKPNGVRIANDKNNERILIKFDYVISSVQKHIVISYSTKSKSFITPHSYYFDEAFNTKTKLYMQCADDHVGCSLHNFIISDNGYGSYDNVLDALGNPTIKPSKLSIIINTGFETVKYLEFITYKLTKYTDSTNVDFTISPVEEYIIPFAGNTLSIYNNNINTGVLDINVNDEAAKNIFAAFDKPYWDLGVWNFSYLYNRGSELNTGLSATQMSRVFGNYFVIEFTFNNIDGHRVDFEELNYNISEI